ncbi:flavin-dependent oxidoreductase [Rhodanobacter sp. Si-c]|uniref:Flavin-dependent oxidoreductase n=1 Tax=Rhodanobacter lycopersici TaxID=3162487 RepID=A0ABV3QGJ8_9GAMM
MSKACDVLIVGAGIAGLTLALELHAAGITCQVYEAAPELKPLGVGINVLPHAVCVLDRLGLRDRLAAVAVTTKESAYFNHHGQLIYREPAGVAAGYAWPQFSIHRGDLHEVLLQAVRERLGTDAVVTDRRCTDARNEGDLASTRFVDSAGAPHDVTASVVVACDGIHSALRKQFYPDEGAPRYSGNNMWRGAVKWAPFLSGATMVRAGWFTVGKMVIYPIRDAVDADGNQLVNWVAEIARPQPARRDWTGRGRVEDVLPTFADWRFDWLDVAGLIESTTEILEYPMVDQDPLPRWTFDRLTLLGDAAHPMVPRGSNGAGQAILDASFIAEQFKQRGVGPEALVAYEQVRLKATSDVVLMNRKAPPDKILQVVHERTNGARFERIEDVVGKDELADIVNQYKAVAGYALDQLNVAR